MFKPRVLVLAAILLAGQVSAGAAQSLAVPSPMPPPGKPAPADAGPCMWAALPAAIKTEGLKQETGIEALLWIIDAMMQSDRAALEASIRACGVGDDQVRSAGRRLAGWMGRVWSENRLEGRLSVAQLDDAYRAISAADKTVLMADPKQNESLRPARRAASLRFFDKLGVDPQGEDGKTVLLYLLSRVGDEADLANGL